MPFDPYKALFFYILSSGMDAIDGYAARAFNQSKYVKTEFTCVCFSIIFYTIHSKGSRFGAVLDMVTDR